MSTDSVYFLFHFSYQAYLGWSIHQSTYMNYMGCGYVYEATQCNYDPAEDDYEEYIQVQMLKRW